jgi:hypothetical protein
MAVMVKHKGHTPVWPALDSFDGSYGPHLTASMAVMVKHLTASMAVMVKHLTASMAVMART